MYNRVVIGGSRICCSKILCNPLSTILVLSYIKVFIIPIIWIVVCVIIQILFMKNKRNRQLVFGILLFALGFRTLFDIVVQSDFLSDFPIEVIIDKNLQIGKVVL